MSKEKLYQSLTKEQQDFIDFLLDNAYCTGYSAGMTDGRIAEKYDNEIW